MIKIRASISIIAALLFLLGVNLSYAQVLPKIPISQPVHGYLAFDAESRLMMLDTFTGDLSTLVELVYPRPISHPHWNLRGNRIVYGDTLDTKIIAPFDSLIPSPLILHRQGTGVFDPQDWSPDGQRVLGIYLGYDWDYYEIQIVNVANPLPTIIRHDIKERPLSENSQLEFSHTVRAEWNPVYSEWIVAELSTYPVGTEEDIERPAVTVVIFMNYSTGETHLLNDVMNEEIDWLPPFAWSPDGRRLIIRTGEFGDFTQMVSVLDINGKWQFAAGSNVPLPQQPTTSVLGWLGIGDLFMIVQFERDTDVQTYAVAQSIKGTLHTIEFFSLDVATLTTGPVPIIGAGSWHLAANDDERRKLSCLFDQALPTRLAVGNTAQVISPTLNVWKEPTFEGTPITRLTTDTEITVIGSAACFNAEDYYRLWQVQLADGTIGWGAEADTAAYFLEP
jgi:hypothetical protein